MIFVNHWMMVDIHIQIHCHWLFFSFVDLYELKVMKFYFYLKRILIDLFVFVMNDFYWYLMSKKDF
jgi:hypothetical protein